MDGRMSMADMYWKVKREPWERSLAEAIRHHSQACGFVAHVFNVHPDTVAEAVAEDAKLSNLDPDHLPLPSNNFGFKEGES